MQSRSKYSFVASASREELGLLYTAIFEFVGYFSTPGGAHAHLGIDQILYRPDFSEPEIALRCRPDNQPVIGAQELRRFWEKVTERGYVRAVFITNRTFTPSAREYCLDRELVAIDTEDLESGLGDFFDEERAGILRNYDGSRTSQQSAQFSRQVEHMLKS